VPPAVFKTVCGALLRRPGWVRFPSIPATFSWPMTAKTTDTAADCSGHLCTTPDARSSLGRRGIWAAKPSGVSKSLRICRAVQVGYARSAGRKESRGERSHRGGALSQQPPVVPRAVRVAELQIWQLPHEVLPAFNLDGVELFRRPGTIDHVELTPEVKQILHTNHVIVAHNHPLERSFSTEDVNMACSYDIDVLRVISPGHVYTLTPPKDGSIPQWCEEVLFRRGGQVEAEVNAALYASVQSGDMTDEQARQQGQHRTYTKLAQELSFDYWRVPIPGPPAAP
jgi:hypothetical protein